MSGQRGTAVVTLRERAGRMLATGGGWLLGAVFFMVGRLRRGRRKALHPRGAVVSGLVHRHGGAATGVAWLDQPGTDDVIVRLSRSLGLPPPCPDVLGLAMRIPVGHGYGDVLLATTGSGKLGRYLLRPARRAETATHSSLFPFRTPSGPLLLAAFPATDRSGHFELAHSGLTSDWTRFGTLNLLPPAEHADAQVSFDPVVNTVPGLGSYPWARRLRQYAYAAARRARQVH
jgi:hypothetical protein